EGTRRAVRDAEMRHEDLAVDKALAVEVADVDWAVDGHGAEDEVVMAAAEVVQALVLGRRSSAAATSVIATRSIAPASPRMHRGYGRPGRVTKPALTLRTQSSRRAPSNRTSSFPSVA